jgi:prepilin-type processing-associated H-X9-DG protein/prepilin-type N-terminal cleavage/methylation domain-containing protein
MRVRAPAHDDRRPRHPVRCALTLLEVLIAIAVIGLLMAILIPAVSAAREASRRTQCQSNMHQVGVAIHAYEATERVFPNPRFTVALLPYIDRSDVYDLFPSPKEPDYAKLHARVNPIVIPLYICPSDTAPMTYSDPDEPDWRVARANYVGSIGTAYPRYGWNGFFVPSRRLSPRDFTRGLSVTTALSEALCPLPDGQSARLRTTWDLGVDFDGPTEVDAFADRCERIPLDPASHGYRGTSRHGIPWHALEFPTSCYFNHVLPPNRPNCRTGTTPGAWAYASASMHPGGANVLFADGHVDFISQLIDRPAWREMGSRVPLDQIAPPD